jgi:ankyrin repeat protein
MLRPRRNRHSGQQYSALHLATYIGCPELVDSFLSSEDNPCVDSLDCHNQPPLVVAVKRGFTDVLTVLLQHNARVDLGNQIGHVLLLYACQENAFETVETILRTAIQRCAVLDQGSIGDRLTNSVATSDRTVVTIPGTHVELLKAAYDKDGTKVLNLLDTCEHSPLFPSLFLSTAFFFAIERGAIEIVSIFLERAGLTTDVNMRDYVSRTALHRAASRGSAPIVKLLLRNKAEVDPRDADGETPWSANAYMGQGKETGMII